MCSSNKFNLICLIKLRYYVTSKKITSTTGTHRPTGDIIGVGPHQITHCTIMWHLLLSINDFNLIESSYWGWEATMHTKYLIIDYWGKWQIIKDLCTVAPHVNWAILAQTFIIETVYLSDLSWFVVATDQPYTIWVPYLNKNCGIIIYFESKKKEKGLNWVKTSIDKISHE